MDLISALASGFAAAANGTAQIYVRGNSTRATVYDDFEASSSDSSGADVALDAHGSALVYVNQLVDVVVKDADGVSVREFTAGAASPNVEVRSLAFTGVDYVTGVSAAGNPTTLQEVLDLWKTNSGATDWKVLLGGAPVTLQVAVGVLNGFVFNVKNPAYGAVGDGVVNDQAAIAAALAAAVAAGGGIVFFPKGTYLITTAIEWDHRVSILGVGATASIITSGSAANARILTWTSGSAQSSPVWIAGMAFAATQANTGEQIYSTVAVNLCIERCILGQSANATGVLLSIDGISHLRIHDSWFNINSGVNTAATWSVNTYALLTGCVFSTTQTAFAGSMVKTAGYSSLIGCHFDITTLTAPGTRYAVEMLNSTDVLTAEDCAFVPHVGVEVFAACLRLLAGGISTVSGSTFSTSPRYSVTGVLGSGSHLELDGVSRTTAATTAFTVPDAVGQAEYWLTGTVPTITSPTMLFPGQRLTLLINNQSAGNWGNTTLNGFSKYGTVDTSALIGHIVVVEAVVSTIPAGGGATYSWVAIHAKGDSL